MPKDSKSSLIVRRTWDAAPDHGDAASMHAAVERMRAAVRDGDTFERLRTALAELALAIARFEAQFQAAAIEPEAPPGGKGVDMALLREFETRIEGLIAFLGNGTAAATADLWRDEFPAAAPEPAMPAPPEPTGALPEPVSAAPPDTEPRPLAVDPLAPLKAMSDAEKIALFS